MGAEGEGSVVERLAVEINANAKQSNTAIDNLLGKLTQLSGALSKYKTEYVATMSEMANSIGKLNGELSRLDTKDMKAAVHTLNSLASAAMRVNDAFNGSAGIASFGKAISNAVGNADRAMARSSKSAKEASGNIVSSYSDAAKEIAKSFGFDKTPEGRKAIPNIADALREAKDYQFPGMMGNGDFFADAMSTEAGQNIGYIVEKVLQLARADNEAYQQHKQLADYIKSNAEAMGGYLGRYPHELGDFTDADRRLWGKTAHVKPKFDGEMPIGFDVLGENANSLFPGVANFTGSAEDMFAQMHKFLSDFKQEEAKLFGEDAVKQMGMTNNPASYIGWIVSDYLQQVEQVRQAATEGGSVAQQISESNDKIVAAIAGVSEKGFDPNNNGFDSLAKGLQSLVGITLPDFSGIEYLTQALGRISSEKVINAGPNLQSIAEGLRYFENLNIADVTGIASLFQAINEYSKSKGESAAKSLQFIADGLKSLSGISIDIDTEKLAALVTAIGELGKAKVERAADVLPKLADALRNFLSAMSDAEPVREDILNLVQSLGQLTSSMGGGGGMDKSALLAHRLLSQMDKDSKSADNGMKNLLATMIKFKMIVTGLMALLRGLWSAFSGSVKLASDLVEVQNRVDTVFGSVSKQVNDNARNAIKTVGMSELTYKQTASTFQAMIQSMGVTDGAVAASTKKLESLGNTYAGTADKATDMSLVLTNLAGDMASFYDVDQQTMARALASGVLTGQTRVLRQYGIDLTQATVQEWAMKQGLDANMQSMTQAQKAMLRYQYVLARTGAAQGDFQRTFYSWANQTRMLAQQLQNVGSKFGAMFINAFKPAVIAMNNFLSAVTTFAENVLNALGKIFGWEAEVYASGVPMDSSIGMLADDLGAAGDAADGLGGGAGDAAKGLGDAADNAKKLKQQLQGFDKLNLLTTNADSGSSGGSGGSGGGGSGSGGGGTGGGGANGDGAVTVAFRKTKTAFESEIDSLYELGEYIGDTLTRALKSIDWDSVYSAAQGFGNGLAQFLNGLISDDLFYELGRLVANSINTVFRSLFGFGMAFNFKDLGTAIASGIKGVADNFDWETIKLTFQIWGKGLAQTINNAITPDSFGSIGTTAGKALSSVFAGAGTFFKTVNGREIGKSIGKAISSFITNIDADDFADAVNGLVDTLWEALAGALEGFDWSGVAVKLAEILSKLDLGKIKLTIGGIIGFKMAAAGVSLSITALKLFILKNLLAKLGIGVGLFNGAGTVAGAATGATAGSAAVTGATAGGAGTAAAGAGITLGGAAALAASFLPLLLSQAYVSKKLIENPNYGSDWKPNEGSLQHRASGLSSKKNEATSTSHKSTMAQHRSAGLSAKDTSLQQANIKAALSIDVPGKPILKKASEGISNALKKYPAKLGLTTENKGKKPNVTVNGKIESVTDALPGNKKVINNTTASVNTLKDDVRNKMFGGGSVKVDKLTDAITPAGKVLNNGNIILKSSTDALSKAFKNVNKGNITYSTSKDSLSAKHKNIDKGNITLVSKKMGSAFNYTVDSMKASFTDHSKGKGFSSTIGEMKSSFKYRTLANGFDKTIYGMTAQFKYKSFASSFSKTIGGFTAGINSWFRQANGGVFSAGRWRPVQAYANGGYVNTNGYSSAQLFVAREAGPELVGTIGNHTAVLNNDQIVASVSNGVYKAQSEQNSLLRQQNQLLQAILQKETGISTRDVFSAVQSENRRYYARTGKNALVY